MTELGEARSTFYFESCGEINTKKTIELAIERAKLLGIKTMIVASETGLSALKLAEMCTDTDVRIIVVTSPRGTKVEGTPIGDLRIGIENGSIRSKLLKEEVDIVQGTDPFFSIDAPLQERGFPTTTYIIRRVFSLFGSGIGVGIVAAMMATDAGGVPSGEDVVSLAGDWIGLSSAIVVETANTRDFLKQGPVIKEIICKPRNPRYSWPDLVGWNGDLSPYEKFC